MGRENVKNIQKTTKFVIVLGGNSKFRGGGGISPLKALKKTLYTYSFVEYHYTVTWLQLSNC